MVTKRNKFDGVFDFLAYFSLSINCIFLCLLSCYLLSKSPMPLFCQKNFAWKRMYCLNSIREVRTPWAQKLDRQLVNGKKTKLSNSGEVVFTYCPCLSLALRFKSFAEMSIHFVPCTFIVISFSFSVAKFPNEIQIVAFLFIYYSLNWKKF